jgi:hypothetical protein
VDTLESSAPTHLSSDEKRLAQLEERFAHELMNDEERQELRDEIARLRR